MVRSRSCAPFGTSCAIASRARGSVTTESPTIRSARGCSALRLARALLPHGDPVALAAREQPSALVLDVSFQGDHGVVLTRHAGNDDDGSFDQNRPAVADSE